jgi:hypothetical protein
MWMPRLTARVRAESHCSPMRSRSQLAAMSMKSRRNRPVAVDVSMFSSTESSSPPACLIRSSACQAPTFERAKAVELRDDHPVRLAGLDPLK